MDILLSVWREACRHIEIRESTERIALLLAEHLPAAVMMIRQLDGGTVETIAVGGPKPGRLEFPASGRSECSPGELEELWVWFRQGEVLHAAADEIRRRWPAVMPAQIEGNVLAGPLVSDGTPIGVLLLVALPPEAFTAAHRAVVQALLEPFAVALENHRRVHEMTRLREAAEADKHTLLTKLGRPDISDTIVGADAGLRPVLQRVEQVARSDVPVLILGETGSGKEVIARAIHTRSKRAAGPFLRVNCGAIPSELIDSELFGHERGSFTGAVNLRKGWFERSDGGTLFLDEVGELPPQAQVRLLRILQDGTYERVGGQRQLKVDVRIVAATHRDLHSMVQDGRFRQDLWYRIAVLPILLPPLRDRPEDIPELAAHFAMRACRRFGLPALAPTPEDIRLLVAYPWPGNVRELGAVMDRAAILGDGHRLDIAKALGVAPASAPPPAAPLSPATALPSPPPLPSGEFPTLDAAMVGHIEAALRKTYGRIEGRYGAAKLLGINPHTLRARMRKLKIDWRRFRQDEDDAPGR